jgi:hypothetical protein
MKKMVESDPKNLNHVMKRTGTKRCPRLAALRRRPYMASTCAKAALRGRRSDQRVSDHSGSRYCSSINARITRYIMLRAS